MECGFEVKAVDVPNHTFCTVMTEKGKEIDVETTISSGFNPGTKKIEQMANSQRITYVPKGNYRDREDNTIMTLIASLYSSSILLLDDSVNPYKGLAMYKKAYYLAPHTELFQKNILYYMNKIALENMDKGNYDKAIDYLSEAIKLDPKNTVAKQNKIYYYNTVALLNMDKGNYEEAIDYLSEAIKLDPKNTVAKQNKIYYYNTVALSSMDKGNYEDAINYLSKVLELDPENTVAKQNKRYYYNKRGNIYLNKKDYPSAIETFKDGIDAMNTDADTELLRKNLKVAYYNYALSENRSKRYNNVSSILDEALLFFPNDKKFINLKNKLPK